MEEVAIDLFPPRPYRHVDQADICVEREPGRHRGVASLFLTFLLGSLAGAKLQKR